MAWVCGVDGFKSQWCAVLRNLDTDDFRARVGPFQDLLSFPENPAIIAVDIPIGLLDVTPPGGRTCEHIARKLVGAHRACSVFSTTGRSALKAASRPEADRISREAGGIGIGAQAWGLSKKLREVDDVMDSQRQHIIREVHPELSFCKMAGRQLDYGKKSREGESERIEMLISAGFPASYVRTMPPRLRVGRDDFLDACAALWTAGRIFLGTAMRIPEIIERDARGLDMAMWF
jgi:predicted RNase H-like nuclease